MTQTVSRTSHIGGGQPLATKPRPIPWLLPLFLAVAAHPAQATVESKLETATCSAIKGWVWNTSQPLARTKVQVYDVTAKGSALLATLTADLPSKGVGDGKHGFAFVPPNSLRNAVAHKLSVRINGTTTELTGSPMITTPCYGQLDDTGWQKCSNTGNGLACPLTSYPRQDGDYGRDKLAGKGQLLKVGAGGAGFDYTKIANNGSELPATTSLGTAAKAWACTRDNVTGLLWEVKTTDPNGLRYTLNTYTWYDPNPATNGGLVGFQDGGSCVGGISCDTHSYVRAVNATKLCGKTNWRMPYVNELMSLEDYSRGKSINPTYFPNTEAYWYLSGTVAPSDLQISPHPARLWGVYATAGWVNDDLGYTPYGAQVRLVSN